MKLSSLTPMLVSAALLGLVAMGCAESINTQENIDPQEQTDSTRRTLSIIDDGTPSKINLDQIFACTGADPAARLDVTVLSRPTSKFDVGSIRLTAKVTNIGTAGYAPRDEETIELWGRGPGGHYFLITQKPLSNVAENESISFDVEREWSPSYEPWEAFKLVITNQAKRDDCNPENNVVERTRAEINALF
jgi:hypothetical protein